MMQRIRTSTDVAQLVAWDSTLSQVALEDAVEKGQAFVVQFEGDCASVVDVYVDEPVPEGLARTPLGEFLLRVPSGRLNVGGAEHYARVEPAQGALSLAPGDYRLCCYSVDQEQVNPAEARLAELVGGEANLAWFDRVTTRAGTLGCLVALIGWPLWSYWLGWKAGLPAAVLSFFLYFWLADMALRKSQRYVRLAAIIPEFRESHELPTVIFELAQLEEPGKLRGGSVKFIP